MSKGIVKTGRATVAVVDSAFYGKVRDVFEQARQFVRTTANFAMVKAYWLVGKMIVEKQGGAAKAAYGDRLIASLSIKLTADLGKGFTEANLRYMRLFYLAFPNCHTLCDELSWSHYRLLISVRHCVMHGEGCRPSPLHVAIAQQANLRRQVQVALAKRRGADSRTPPRTHGNRRRTARRQEGLCRSPAHQEVGILARLNDIICA